RISLSPGFGIRLFLLVLIPTEHEVQPGTEREMSKVVHIPIQVALCCNGNRYAQEVVADKVQLKGCKVQRHTRSDVVVRVVRHSVGKRCSYPSAKLLVQRCRKSRHKPAFRLLRKDQCPGSEIPPELVRSAQVEL